MNTQLSWVGIPLTTRVADYALTTPMKKILFLLLVLIVVFLIWYFLPNRAAQKSQPASEPPQLAATNSHTASTAIVLQPTNNTIESINPLMATNLEQWKHAIKDLTQLGGISGHQCWIMELHKADGSANRDTGRLFVFSQDGKTLTYSAAFIAVTTRDGTENLLEVEMQTPNMNIDGTRALGLELCNLFGFDSTKFQAWCDRVGNHWVDAPLYGIGSGNYSINVRNTFNNEKPWRIDLDIGYQ